MVTPQLVVSYQDRPQVDDRRLRSWLLTILGGTTTLVTFSHLVISKMTTFTQMTSIPQ